MWQYLELSEQIRPRDTLSCCWDVKQPSNKQIKLDRSRCWLWPRLVSFMTSSVLHSSFFNICLSPSLLQPRWPSGYGVRLESGRSRVRIPLATGFSGSSHTSDLKIGTPVATLPGAWHYRVSAGTGRPGVSILWLGEVESLICNFYLSVAARKFVWADPSLRYTIMLLGR